MGGTISIGYAAENPAIRGLVSDCAFSSISDTVATSMRPKELWFEPDVAHAEFLKSKPAEFEQKLTGFFDRYLSEKKSRH